MLGVKSVEKWTYIWNVTTRLSLPCVKRNEHWYKIIMRWHFTPKNYREKMNHTGKCLCWICDQTSTDMYHIWWKHLIITDFGKVLKSKIQELAGVQLPMNPVILLADYIHDI